MWAGMNERTTRPVRRHLSGRAGHHLRELGAPLAERDARQLWMAQLASHTGDWAGRLALAVLVLQRTGSPALTGLVTTVSLLPWVGLGQLLATLGDRYPRRRVMVGADLVRAVAFGAMLLPIPIVAIVALAFVAGLATPPFEAARAALARDVIDDERYGGFLALGQVTQQSAVIAGYLAGGALVSFAGARFSLLVNAVSFAASALLVVRVRGGGSGHGAASARDRLGAAARFV